MEERILNIYVADSDKIDRVDKYLAEIECDVPEFDACTRSYIQKLIKDGNISVNNKIVKPNYKVNYGDCISVHLPAPVELNIEPEDIPIDIVYEDDDLIIVNKPKQMVVHPAAGHTSGTLVNALLYHCKDNLSSINGVMRPGIVHRIDMDTTGLLIVCKNNKAHNSISEQLRVHSITRRYEAIVHNKFKVDSGVVNAPLGRSTKNRKQMAIIPDGKNAITHYKVINNLNGNFAHIMCELETGRTHQIRVHMASLNHSLLGDSLYGPGDKFTKSLTGQTLHARVIGFTHPTTGEYMEFSSPLPEYFEELLNKL